MASTRLHNSKKDYSIQQKQKEAWKNTMYINIPKYPPRPIWLDSVLMQEK